MAKKPSPDVQEKMFDAVNKIHMAGVDHFFVTYLGLFKKHDPQTAAETTAVCGTLCAALLHVAATIGQDLGMSVDTMKATLGESYQRAIDGAPKWGE